MIEKSFEIEAGEAQARLFGGVGRGECREPEVTFSGAAESGSGSADNAGVLHKIVEEFPRRGYPFGSLDPDIW